VEHRERGKNEGREEADVAAQLEIAAGRKSHSPRSFRAFPTLRSVFAITRLLGSYRPWADWLQLRPLLSVDGILLKSNLSGPSLPLGRLGPRRWPRALAPLNLFREPTSDSQPAIGCCGCFEISRADDPKPAS
jgi:hypothetical protein